MFDKATMKKIETSVRAKNTGAFMRLRKEGWTRFSDPKQPYKSLWMSPQGKAYTFEGAVAMLAKQAAAVALTPGGAVP